MDNGWIRASTFFWFECVFHQVSHLWLIECLMKVIRSKEDRKVSGWILGTVVTVFAATANLKPLIATYKYLH